MNFFGSVRGNKRLTFIQIMIFFWDTLMNWCSLLCTFQRSRSCMAGVHRDLRAYNSFFAQYFFLNMQKNQWTGALNHWYCVHIWWKIDWCGGFIIIICWFALCNVFLPNIMQYFVFLQFAPFACYAYMWSSREQKHEKQKIQANGAIYTQRGFSKFRMMLWLWRCQI